MTLVGDDAAIYALRAEEDGWIVEELAEGSLIDDGAAIAIDYGEDGEYQGWVEYTVAGKVWLEGQ